MTSSTEQSTPVTIYLPFCHVKNSGPYLSPAINLSLCFNTNSHNGKPLLACMHQEKLSAKKSVSEDGMCFALLWEMFQYIAGMCVVVYWFSTWQDLETPWRQISRYVCEGLCGKDLPLMNKYFRGPITRQGVEGTSRSGGRREGEKRDLQLLGWRESLG